jgi:3-hydroxyisobutyrate dehydrogenase-like beta-hydroxyacid dehydrogenase
MARRIVDEGFPLTIWARRAASLEPFADTPATVAATPAELGAASDVVGICVVSDADVDQVLSGSDGVLAGMAPGGVIAIHSTIHPDSCRRLADVAAARGVAVIDAPVSGGGGAAAERQLLVMVGGDNDAVERCRPVLATYGDPVVHLGPLGSGQMAKLLNNLIFTALITPVLELFEVADGLGVDRAQLATVLGHGSGGSRVAGILAASGFDLTGFRGAQPLLAKDVGIIRNLMGDGPGGAELLELAQHTLTRMLAGDGSV